MILSPTSVAGRDGAVRPSRPLPDRMTALVVSPDPAVRAGWADLLESAGIRVLRCAGPTVSCALLRGGARCPLHDEADAAIYDEASLNATFLERVRLSPPSVPIAAATDRADDEVEHEPVVTRIVSRPFPRRPGTR